jgi:hypothetical protein
MTQAPDRARHSRMTPALIAPVVVLTAVVLMLGVASPGNLVGHALVAAAAVAALAIALGHTAYAPALRPVRVRSDRAGGHVEAPTAYWCAVAAPSRPQRPRAPGRD